MSNYRLDDEELKRKISSSMLGFAIGDALGAGFEFMVREGMKQFFPNVDFYRDDHPTWLEGEGTDDTDLMLLVADSISEHGGLYLEDVSSRLKDWLWNEAKDVELLLLEILERARWDDSPLEEITNKHEEILTDIARNDPVTLKMMLPIGLFYYKDIDTLVEQSKKLSLLINPNEKIAETCTFYSLLIARCLVFRDKTELLQQLNIDVNTYFSTIDFSVFLSNEKLNLEHVSHFNTLESINQMLQVVLTMFFKKNDFLEGLKEIITMGGDTDTTAALYGGIYGAFHGKIDLPRRWMTILKKRELVNKTSTKLFLSIIKQS